MLSIYICSQDAIHTETKRQSSNINIACSSFQVTPTNQAYTEKKTKKINHIILI